MADTFREGVLFLNEQVPFIKHLPTLTSRLPWRSKIKYPLPMPESALESNLRALYYVACHIDLRTTPMPSNQ